MSVKKHSSGEEGAWESSFQNTISGGGVQFPLLDCRAKARIKGVRSSQTQEPANTCLKSVVVMINSRNLKFGTSKVRVSNPRVVACRNLEIPSGAFQKQNFENSSRFVRGIYYAGSDWAD